MLFKICVILLFACTLVIAQNNDSCSATQGSLNNCYRYISTNCQNAALVADQSEWGSCPKIELFWNYPKNNLTITYLPIPKPPSAKRQSYRLCLQPVGSSCAETFRVLQNNKSIKVTWSDSSAVCFRNENGVNSFTFRFQGGTLLCYGVYIRASIK